MTDIINLIGTGNVDAIVDALENDISADEYCHKMLGNSVMVVLQKYYFRSSGNATLSVFIWEPATEALQVSIVASGGGSGLANMDLGAEDSFVNKAVKVLEKMGFQVME